MTNYLSLKKKLALLVVLLFTVFGYVSAFYIASYGYQILEIVEMKLNMTEPSDLDEVEVYRITIRNYLFQVPKEGAGSNSWIHRRGTIKKLWIRLQEETLSRLDSIDIRIGTFYWSFNREEFLRGWMEADTTRYYKDENTRTYEAPKGLRSASVLNRIMPLVNWHLTGQMIGNGLLMTLVLTFPITVFIWFGVVYVISQKNRLEVFFEDERRLFLLLLPILGLIIHCLFIFIFSKNLIWQDTIDFVFLRQRYVKGQLSAQDFWTQHNEHRIPLSKLIFFLGTFIKPINTILLSLFNQIVLFFTAMVALEMLTYDLVGSNSENLHSEKTLSYFIVVYFLYSPIHIFNILFAFQSQWFLTVLGLFLSFSAMVRTRLFVAKPTFWIGFLIAFLAMPNWTLLLPVVVVFSVFRYVTAKNRSDEQVRQRIDLKNILIFSPFFMLSLFIYLWGWEAVPVSPVDTVFKFPLRFLMFFFAILGNQIPFAPIAIVLGVLVFAISIYGVLRSFSDKSFFCSQTIVLFSCTSICFAFLVAVGRSAHSIDTAVASRYAIVSSPIWIAASLIVIGHYVTKKIRKPKWIILGVIFFTIVQFQYGIFMANTIRNMMAKDSKLVYESLERSDPELLMDGTLYPELDANRDNRDHVFQIFSWLRKYGYLENPQSQNSR